MSKPVKIACIGEVMIELSAQGNDLAKIGVGGDSFNTAAYLAQLAKKAGLLNSDVQVNYVTALGDDQFSKRIISEIERNGVKSDLVEVRKKQMPGLYAIETDDQGERTFAYWRGQSAAKSLFQEPCDIKFEALLEFDLVYISGISMAILPVTTRNELIEFLAHYKSAGGKLAYDSNYRPHLWEDIKTAQDTNMAMWALADIAMPSIDDEMLLFEDKSEKELLERLSSVGVKFGALKRGEEGPLFLGKGKEELSSIQFESAEKVVDTTAAGDSFNAGFLFEYARASSIKDALLRGHNVALKVIQSKGAIIDLD